MKNLSFNKNTALILAFFFALIPSGFSKQFEISSQHSFVNFEVDYMKVSVVKGTFDDFEGSFTLDPKTGKVSNLDFSITAKSINTRDYKRDKHLRDNDFFHVKKHPQIFFTGTGMKYKDGVLSEITGTLELVGVLKPITFAVDWRGFMSDPIDKGKKSLFLRAKTTINRKDFGLTWNRALDSGGWIVSEKVRLDVVIEATPSDSRPAFSRFLKRNRKIKNNPLDQLNQAPKAVAPEKKSPELAVSKNQKKKKPSANDYQGLKSYLPLLVGFIIFIGLIVSSGFLKKAMMSFLEKHFSETVAELVSDVFLYSFVLAAAILSAPYMGYGDFFSK